MAIAERSIVHKTVEWLPPLPPGMKEAIGAAMPPSADNVHP